MRIGEVEAEPVDIVQALVDVHPGPGLAAGHLQGLERGPGSESGRQVVAGFNRRDAEDAAGASEKVKLNG